VNQIPPRARLFVDASVIAFDLEATGLNPEFDRIVEFCLIGLDNDLNDVSRWTERVNPGIPIPQETTDIHGIADADVAELPIFAHHAAKIQKALEGATLMAYNHGYDLNLIHYELTRHGQPGLDMDHPVIDPLVIFRQNHPHSLSGAVKHYLDRELGDDEAHSADGDAAAMVDVFRAQIKAHGLPATAEGNLVQRDRRFLDRAKRFYEDAEGISRFGFGKHRHEPVAKHVDYLQWMLAKDFPEETKNVAKQLADTLIEKAPARQSSL
jgi:DNA polymerase-3 subunit epsilon